MLSFMCNSVLVRQSGCWGVRKISSAEIATALRPFYFVVHPDLFGRHPKQRSINEDSLKQLSAHLEASQDRRVPTSSPDTISFYLRNNASSSENVSDEFKLVRISLGRRVDTKMIIKDLLKTCNLSTDYVDTIRGTRSEPNESNGISSRRHHSNPETGDKYYGNTYANEREVYERIQKVKHEKKLKSWLSENLATAHSRSAAMKEIQEDVTRLEAAIVKRLRLANIHYDCGWNVEHYRGCLKSLNRMADMYEQDMHPLVGRTLMFALCSGVSLDGHVMLFTGDVHHNWLDFIKNISAQDDYLQRIPAYEAALSQVLLGIRVARRKFMPKAQVINYAAQLRRVTTSMLDHLTYGQFPKSWPNRLEEFEIVIESESGPLMVSPTGQFIAPSTCSGHILVDFLTQHMDEARQKIAEYNTNKYVERELHTRCIAELQLQSLSKDDSIDPNMMIACLQRLLATDAMLGNAALNITNYYSVLADGTVCIPWNWSLE